MIKLIRAYLTILFIPLLCLNVFANEEKLIASDGDARHRFGAGVVVDSSIIAVGSPGTLSDGDYRGAVYIYEFDDTDLVWLESQKLEIPDDDLTLDLFGLSLAKSDSFLIVGARGDSVKNPFGGAAYIFKQGHDRLWSFFQKLRTSQFVPLDQFGYSVDIDGHFAVVGAPRTGGQMPQSGAVYVYQLIGTEWVLDAKLVAAPGRVNDYFGVSVDLSGNDLIVGASGIDVKTRYPQQSVGSAFVFQRDEHGWLQTAYLFPQDGNAGNLFGCAVALDGDYAVIGARKDDVLNFDDGSVYIYQRDDLGWQQHFKLTAMDADSGDYFGASVGLHADYIVVGAPGVNGWGKNTGAVYSFLRGDEGWTQRAKKTAYDAEPFDGFGAALAVSKNQSVVGAPHKDVAGHMSQGAAYVYDNIDDLALPVELSMFTATVVEGGVLLQWLTQSEKDNLGFILQRRSNSDVWRTITSFQINDDLRGQGSTSMPTFYEFLDDSVNTDQDNLYRLADVDYSGLITWHDPISVAFSSAVGGDTNHQPQDFKLFPAYPNPFNPQTVLRYELPNTMQVTIDVLDMTGRHVRTLVSTLQSAGSYATVWDGRNDAGLSMSSGIYFIRIHAEKNLLTQKVILMR